MFAGLFHDFVMYIEEQPTKSLKYQLSSQFALTLGKKNFFNGLIKHFFFIFGFKFFRYNILKLNNFYQCDT